MGHDPDKMKPRSPVSAVILASLFMGTRRVCRALVRPPLAARQLNPMDQACQRHLQGVGDSNQSVQGDVFLSAFNLPDVFVTQVCFFGQFFLAQTSLLAIVADVLANSSTIRVRHKPYTETRSGLRRNPIYVLILSLRLF